MQWRNRYYIPVCLYPHTKYRTAAGLAALFQKFSLSEHDYLIVVADRLLALDRMVTGRYWTITSAHNRASREAKQIVSLIRRMAAKSGASGRGDIMRWDDIATTSEYLDFTKRLQRAVLSDEMLSDAIEAFVERRITRYGLGAFPDKERGYEREYLLSEVSMSVFCTENLGFSTEVWERPPQADAPDPLKLLYRERRQIVSEVTGRPATRVLTFLFSGDAPTAPDNKYEQHQPD